MRSAINTVTAGAILLLASSPLFATPRGATTAPEPPHAVSPAPGVVALPDLLIVQITKARRVQVQVRNAGNGNASSSVLAVRCSLGTTAGGAGVQTTALFSAPALKAGEAAWINLTNCTPVSAVIDPDNVVKESSEKNNTYSVNQ